MAKHLLLEVRGAICGLWTSCHFSKWKYSHCIRSHYRHCQIVCATRLSHAVYITCWWGERVYTVDIWKMNAIALSFLWVVFTRTINNVYRKFTRNWHMAKKARRKHSQAMECQQKCNKTNKALAWKMLNSGLHGESQENLLFSGCCCSLLAE